MKSPNVVEVNSRVGCSERPKEAPRAAREHLSPESVANFPGSLILNDLEDPHKSSFTPRDKWRVVDWIAYFQYGVSAFPYIIVSFESVIGVQYFSSIVPIYRFSRSWYTDARHIGWNDIGIWKSAVSMQFDVLADCYPKSSAL